MQHFLPKNVLKIVNKFSNKMETYENINTETFPAKVISN